MNERLQELLGAGTSALLVIDIQNDYIHPEGSAGRGGRDTSGGMEMMPRVHHIIATARDRGVPVYFLRNWHSENTNSVPWKARRAASKGVGGEAAVAGTWGAEWYEVEPRPDDVVINKFRYDGFLGTPLEVMLRARGVETVICFGTATNVCVESTARAAHMRDFHLVLVSDCCSAYDQDLHDATLKNVRKHFGLVATAEEVEAAWPAARSETGTENRLVEVGSR
ncbi:MAG TPA: isochorismatase family cysteine hydrolase [Candidatus Limnocylindrales bacterium]|nr:isochorismatase family cysteine hydrolase [Candidatus Limnocylindrales bacterium]